MKELLSNEEIDTLLEMFRSEGGEPEEAEHFGGVGAVARESLVSPVDLLKPNRLRREHMQLLERVLGSCSKALGAAIADTLRCDMKCDCVAVEQTRFASWMQSIGAGTAIYMLRPGNGGSPVMWGVTSNLLYGAVDRILGGTGKVSQVPKEFSEAEYTVADAFLEPCVEQVANALTDIIQGDWEVQNRFTNPSFANVIPSQDVVLTVHFQVGGEFLLGDIRIAIPYSALESGLHKFTAKAVDDATGQVRAMIDKVVRPVDVELSVLLGEAQLPLQHLLALKPGDVVPLGTRLGDPLVAPVQGVPKFHGQVGVLGNRLAYQVADVLDAG